MQLEYCTSLGANNRVKYCFLTFWKSGSIKTATGESGD